MPSFRDSAKIWPASSQNSIDKFEAVIAKFGLKRRADGLPVPVEPADRLVSPDGGKVFDPINGKPYTLLRHHIRTSYDFTHQELLEMFGLRCDQLPDAAPAYQEAKAQAALGQRKL
jgi:predicted transcriptional regulator